MRKQLLEAAARRQIVVRAMAVIRRHESLGPMGDTRDLGASIRRVQEEERYHLG
jgi:hypothetical protein